jgi:hypothetical protein
MHAYFASEILVNLLGRRAFLGGFDFAHPQRRQTSKIKKENDGGETF